MISECEHIIGFLYDYDSSRTLTLNELIEHIVEQKQLNEWFRKSKMKVYNVYELSDYTDKRKSTDIDRFNFCPLCGKEINWKELKGWNIKYVN